MNFRGYSLDLRAEITPPIEFICPQEGWDSKFLAITVKLKCERCGTETRTVRICKDDVVNIPPVKKKKIKKKKNPKPRDFIKANAKVKCESCPRREGYVIVTGLPGEDLINGMTVTFMDLMVSNMTPTEVCDFQFYWTAKVATANATFQLDDHAEAMVNVYDQGAEEVIVRRVTVRSTFSGTN